MKTETKISECGRYITGTVTMSGTKPVFGKVLKGAKADCFVIDEIQPLEEYKVLGEYKVEDVYMYFGGSRNIKRYYAPEYEKWLEEIEGGKEESMAGYRDYDCSELVMLEREMGRIREIITCDYSLSSARKHVYMEEYERLDRRRGEVKRQRRPDPLMMYGGSRDWSPPPPPSFEHAADATRYATRLFTQVPMVQMVQAKRAEDISVFRGIKHHFTKEMKMKIYQVFVVDKKTKLIDSNEYVMAKSESHAKLVFVSRGINLVKKFIAVSCSVANLPEKWDDETA